MTVAEFVAYQAQTAERMSSLESRMAETKKYFDNATRITRLQLTQLKFVTEQSSREVDVKQSLLTSMYDSVRELAFNVLKVGEDILCRDEAISQGAI